uniref:Uncharacterized protein n=1 Tax=Polytomella parva TaxID=51329 RepID=A0A7S0V3W1_9CHLO|mmetsp:Transcript_27583/g.50925  ORF Transcript_27583/g.50925 Transcript_27583/m.50925 type:complete len:213 (+) Transcript_27583:2-640(+)
MRKEEEKEKEKEEEKEEEKEGQQSKENPNPKHSESASSMYPSHASSKRSSSPSIQASWKTSAFSKAALTAFDVPSNSSLAAVATAAASGLSFTSMPATVSEPTRPLPPLVQVTHLDPTSSVLTPSRQTPFLTRRKMTEISAGGQAGIPATEGMISRILDPVAPVSFPPTAEGYLSQVRWYSFQFVMDELVTELEESFLVISSVLEKLPYPIW